MKPVRPLFTTALALAPALLILGLTACSRDPVSEASADPGSASATNVLVVHEGPHCGCCGLWREHMQAAGFEVEVHKTMELGAVKATAGVPRHLGSCHTARIGGYFIEGHVPVEEIQRLLVERPKARGLVVTGMPAGSPGMERPDGFVQPYDVLLVNPDGSTQVFARYPKPAESCCSVDFDEDETT
jgi:hypothetical protein